MPNYPAVSSTVYRLQEAGHSALHTRDLPAGNRTPDSDINTVVSQEPYILVTKDADFVNTFWLRRVPPKLFLIATGNIGNRDLEKLLLEHLPEVVAAFSTYEFLELNRTRLIIHA